MTTFRREGAGNETVRAFVAVLLPRALCDAAAEIQEQVRERMPPRSVRWVDPANFHVTVRFLGDLDRTGVESVSGVVREQAGFVPIEASLGSVSAFPNTSRPTVVWIDLIARDGLLESLVHRLERGLIDAGFGPPDKPWRSHLTLGRVERGVRVPVNWHAVPASCGGSYRVDAVALMRSELLPGGPRYTALETAHAAS